MERTQGTETSKYLQEEKIRMIPQVAASERGEAQTLNVTALRGLKDCDVADNMDRRTSLESEAEERDSRVFEIDIAPSRILSRAGPEESCLKRAVPSAKAKYY